ncbi:capsular polysaccharide transport system permease protein [Pseudooceanicola antarcticus]|uniref:Capsular polysaccharide transport system permease protein n=1 Tax=Pseudooceanicola antarcticus TaxID=1247613 RepID=A0A285IH42_9RHOB|nr:capsule biosynthesis protein [Pseudooceanicola antarcticus]PJE28994.1 capsule biosynthesis protein [Pseudooceanicola antarcticus]SNY47320.1 capsular polysaccharide transport system permease protein [Pseudooceanicola antarcticus]
MPSPQVVSPRGSPTRRRQYWVAVTFVACVVLPVILAAWYLWTRAADQYASTLAFTVRSEESTPTLDLLGGLSEFSGASSSDTDILYSYLQSQNIVAAIQRDLDLRGIWSAPGTDLAHGDPVFALSPEATIEELVDHWQRKVKIFYDAGTGLIELRVLAFDPADATHLAEEIYEKSSLMINALSDAAREDAIGYARDEVELTLDRLKGARQAMTEFRNRHQIVDPGAELEVRVGVLAGLQRQLVDAQVELDMLRTRPGRNDVQVLNAEQRIEMIERRIGAERARMGAVGDEPGGQALAELMGQYEVLAVEREFAEATHRAALARFDAAQSEARRQSRYLAAHVRPTVAESARYPERPLLLLYVGLFLGLGWAIAVLSAYAVRDRG